MEEGALQDGPQQGQLLPRRRLAALLQLGLQTLHCFQSSLGICGGKWGREIAPGSIGGIQSSAGAAPAVAL